MDTKNFYKNLGQNLRHHRKITGLTQEQFGAMFGVTKSAIVNYEAGIRKIPIDLLYQIANYYGVTVDSFFCKKHTIAEVLSDEIGKMKLNKKEEDLFINFLHAFKKMKEGN